MELDGCMSDGKTVEELRKNIRDAMKLWLEVSLENGDVIPKPQTESAYSGRFNLRIPRSLHERLSYEAKYEKYKEIQLDFVSLVKYVIIS